MNLQDSFCLLNIYRPNKLQTVLGPHIPLTDWDPFPSVTLHGNMFFFNKKHLEGQTEL